MTWGELLKLYPDCTNGILEDYLLRKKVVFDTSGRHNLEVLSIYYDDKNDVIRIDIGEDGE